MTITEISTWFSYPTCTNKSTQSVFKIYHGYLLEYNSMKHEVRRSFSFIYSFFLGQGSSLHSRLEKTFLHKPFEKNKVPVHDKQDKGSTHSLLKSWLSNLTDISS